MGNGKSIPDSSPLGSILQDWSMFSSEPMKKKKMILFCNTDWPRYQLESGEKWPKNGSLNYDTILQLDSFCKRNKKWDEIPYVQSFMSLHKRRNLPKGFKMMVQREELQKKCVLPVSEPNDELAPPSAPLAGVPLLAPPAVAPPSSPPAVAPPSAPPAVVPPSAPLAVPSTSEGDLPAGSDEAPANPRAAGPTLYSPLPNGHKGIVSLPCTHQGTQFGPGNTLPQAGQLQLRQVPAGLDDPGQPRALGFRHFPLSVTDLHNYKAKMPSYQDDPKEMENLFTFIFAFYHPNWADIQTLMLILLSPEERRMILEKTYEEAERLHELQPNNPIRTPAEQAIPRSEPGWDPNDPGDQARLNHYKECLIAGLQKGAKDFKRVQNVWQRPEESPFIFLERLFEAFRKYTDIDPEHPDNMGLVNIIFISQSTPDIKKKLQGLEGGSWMPMSQLVQIAFEVFQSRGEIWKKQEQRIMRQIALLSCDHSRPSRMSAGEDKRPPVRPWGPPKPGRKGHPSVGPQQCAFCRQKGHWKRECPKNRQGPLSPKTASITGISREASRKPFLRPLECHIEKTCVKYSFTYGHECPSSSSGQVLPTNFSAEKVDTKVFPGRDCTLQATPLKLGDKPQPDFPEEILQKVRADVWADGAPGRAKTADPVVVKLRPGAQAPKLKQYPLKRHMKKGIKPLITTFLKHQLIRPCQSPYNTPIRLVQEPRTGGDRFVQDLRAINQIVEDVHSVMPNPYTLLTALSGDFCWFTVLNIKDGFYCIPLSPESQKLFAFEWDDPETNIKQQYCWTVLPQGFKNASSIFVEALAKDLKDLQLSEGLLLQYVADILIASKTKEASDQNTILTLNFLADRGYKVSRGKAQISQLTVKYLGFELSQGQRNLLPDRRKAIAGEAVPANRKQLRRFLGMAEFCRIWIPNFGLIAKPLYEALKRGDKPLSGAAECHKSFNAIKEKILTAPALGLPDIRKSFDLFVHERQGMSLGVLTQNLDTTRRPVAYFSKQLDVGTQEWPDCLRAVAATCDLLQQAEKFTLGRPTTVHTPHHVQPLLEQKGRHWLTLRRLNKYWAILFDNPNVTLKEVSALNPATLLPSTTEEPVHDCVQIIEEVYSSRPDLTDQPLENPDMEMFTHGSSFMDHGIRKAGYAVVTHEEVLEAETLPPGVSAQKAELIALRRALHLGAKKKVTIYTDSKYAFSVMHAHGAMWKERGLLTSGRKKIKHAEEILALLNSVMMPEEVAIVHCSCRNTDSCIAKGSNLAEQAAKQVARTKKPSTHSKCRPIPV